MSVPPLFKLPKNIFFSIGLPRAENTFYQLPEKELEKQVSLLKENKTANNKNLPVVFIAENEAVSNPFSVTKKSQPLKEEYFDTLFQKMMSHLDKKQIWVRDTFLFQNDERKLKTRHINESPEGDLFALKTFSKPSISELENFDPDWYFIQLPTFFANPKTDGINQKDFAIINFTKKVILIGGVPFTVKLNQEIFSVLDFVLHNNEN